MPVKLKKYQQKNTGKVAAEKQTAGRREGLSVLLTG